MTEPQRTEPAPASERRTHDERRRDPIHRERRGAPRPPGRLGRALRTIGGYLFAIVTLLCVIAYTVARMQPIYAGKARVADQLAARVPAAKPVLPILQAVVTGKNPRRDSTRVDAFMSSPQFHTDKQAFAADLVRTGRMRPGR